MPIYEYRCLKNGHHFEVMQKISDQPLTGCQYCDSPVEKLMSSTSFQLKGSGWYSTDYKPKKASSDTTASGGCGGNCACHGGKKS